MNATLLRILLWDHWPKEHTVAAKDFLITQREVRGRKLLENIANHLRNNVMLYVTKEPDN